MPYKKQAAITRALYGLFSQGIPSLVAYKTEQKKEKERKREKEQELKEKRIKAEIDFYTAMTKDRDPTIRGMSVQKLEELLGKTPYSTVMGGGRGKLGLGGIPSRLPQVGPATMPMGPMAGGAMTRRQPALSEILAGAEPRREHKYPYTQPEVEGFEKFKTGLKPEPKRQLGKTPEERQLDRDLDIIKTYATYDEKDLRDMGVSLIVRDAQNRLNKRAAYPRYAKDADDYFDRMLYLYKGNQQKAKEETIKFIRLMGIEPELLQPYLKER